jgi:Toprim-like/CHC2 zinc finger
MNIKDAKATDLSSILNKIGHVPARQKGHDLWYYSPFRKEKTPSFHVNTAKNVWYDFGEVMGGSVLDFVCVYLKFHDEDHTLADALRWLGNMHGLTAAQTFVEEDFIDCSTTLSLRRITAVQNPTFIPYLDSRGIPFALARKYLKEAYVHNANTGADFYALAIANENGGYELRNKFFKGCIAPKSISFVRGTHLLHDEIHIFEGMMDFLSALSIQKDKKFEGDVIILNSLSCLQHAWPYIKNYSYKRLYSWLDNDAPGQKAGQILKEFTMEQAGMDFIPMNNLYAAHKDVNDWHRHKLGL